MADQKQALKVVKKKWVPITASNAFGNRLIGESLVASSPDLVGRSVSVNAYSVTDDIKLQHINLKFIIKSGEGDKAVAELSSLSVVPPAIKRLVRRGSDRIDDSFSCETSDGIKVRIKPFITTKSHSKGLVSKKLRKEMRAFIISEVKNASFEDMAVAILTGRLQGSVRSSLKKLYPVKSCEIKFYGTLSASMGKVGKSIEKAEKGESETVVPVEKPEDAAGEQEEQEV